MHYQELSWNKAYPKWYWRSHHRWWGSTARTWSCLILWNKTKTNDLTLCMLGFLIRAVEIPCPNCPTRSHFIKDKLKFSIYMSLDKCKICYKVNKILHFIFWLITMSSPVALKTMWILISWLLQKPADLDLHLYYQTSKIFFGQVHYGHLLVPGQVENFTISTPLFLMLLLLSADSLLVAELPL